MAKLFANSGDPDQTLHSAVSDLGLHCLPVTLLRVSRLQWVKKTIFEETKWVCLTLTSQGKFSRWQTDIFLISPETGFDISCKLETICMKYQNLLSGKNKKNILKCRLLKIFSRVLSIKRCNKFTWGTLLMFSFDFYFWKLSFVICVFGKNGVFALDIGIS